MEIKYKSQKLKKIFEDEAKLVKAYGKQARKIIQRMNELYAATSLKDIQCNPGAGLHSLKGNYKTYMAIYLIHPYRLIIEPGDGKKEDLRTIKIIKIIKVIDYH